MHTEINYVIISPVKNEENTIQLTIDSITNQSIIPKRWLIVDDGSDDNTRKIINSAVKTNQFINLLPLASDTNRATGGRIVKTFNYGLNTVDLSNYDYIVKMDCDLFLPSDYFENVFSNFENHPKLGIASGVYFEKLDTGWVKIKMPHYHAAGACKTYRVQCFIKIKGLMETIGWDSIDEIKATAYGWTTCHFPDIHFQHLKKEGSAIGKVKTNIMYGKIYHITSGSPILFIIKLFVRTFVGRPLFLSPFLILYGYLYQIFNRKSTSLNKIEIKAHRNMQWGRILKKHID